MEYQYPMVIEQPLLPVIWKKKRTWKIKEFVQMYREPVVTYSITPNNAPETQAVYDNRGGRNRHSFNPRDIDFESEVYNSKGTSELLLNTINGLFSKFYAPERIRISKNGVKVKLNDLVSYKIVIIDGEMKFYLTVPQKWAKSFTSAIRRDWGQVDITKVKDSERIVDFNPNKTKAMEVFLRHHYALSINHDKNQANDSFYSSLASLASTL